jgi:hypothetical protein
LIAQRLRSLGLFARTTPDGIDVATLEPAEVGLPYLRIRRTLSEPEALALIKMWDPERADELLNLVAQHHRANASNPPPQK